MGRSQALRASGVSVQDYDAMQYGATAFAAHVVAFGGVEMRVGLDWMIFERCLASTIIDT